MTASHQLKSYGQASYVSMPYHNLNMLFTGREVYLERLRHYPHTLTSMRSLASTYRDQGRWKEAEELGIQVMDLRKQVLGEEHPETLTSMHDLTSTYQDQGRWKEAEELGIQVVDMRKRVLGEEHPYTLMSMEKLAATYRGQGRLQELEELEGQVAQIRQRAPPAH